MNIIYKNGYRGALLLLLLLSAVAGVSCSIKETRAECPCFLDVTLSGGHIPAADASFHVFGKGGQHQFQSTLRTADCLPRWEKAVYREPLTLLAWHGSDRVLLGDYAVVVSPGEQFDALYSCRTDVDATGETAEADLRFRKDYATVTVDMGKTLEEMERYRFLVTGSVTGMSLLTKEPVEGDFSYVPAPEGDSPLLRFRIPRQRGVDLLFGVWYRMTDGSFWKAEDFPLGKYIAQTAYDWDDADLKDVEISIDLLVGEVIINVAGWEHGYVFKVYEI